MSLIIPIVVVALIAGTRAVRMTPRLWTLAGVVMASSVAWFYAHH